MKESTGPDGQADKPLSETTDDPQLSSALACVEATPAASDVPAWVGIELYDALANACQEVERQHDAAAKALANQAKLKGMSVEDGAALLELDSPREIVIAWVWAARQMLGDAPNYSETRIDFPTASASMEVKAAGEFDRYVFTVQRAGKVTPHEARRNAEAERDVLSELLRGMARRASARRSSCAKNCEALRVENERLCGELADYARRVTMGGPTVPVDTEWANATLPPPASASDETAPPIRTARGSHRLSDSR